MIRTSRRPSSSSISRTRSRSVTGTVSAISAYRESRGGANLTCYGISSVIVEQKLLPDLTFRSTNCPDSRNESAQQQQSSQQYQSP
jgi:hypothetical protein